MNWTSLLLSPSDHIQSVSFLVYYVTHRERQLLRSSNQWHVTAGVDRKLTLSYLPSQLSKVASLALAYFIECCRRLGYFVSDVVKGEEYAARIDRPVRKSPTWLCTWHSFELDLQSEHEDQGHNGKRVCDLGSSTHRLSTPSIFTGMTLI